MLKGARGLFLFLGGAALLIVGAFYFGFNAQKSDRATAMDFMTHISEGRMVEAHALLEPGVITLDDLRGVLGGVGNYTDVSFPSRSWSTTNGSRLSRYEGTGTTTSGCTSELVIELRNGAINFFDIAPLCRGVGANT